MDIIKLIDNDNRFVLVAENVTETKEQIQTMYADKFAKFNVEFFVIKEGVLKLSLTKEV